MSRKLRSRCIGVVMTLSAAAAISFTPYSADALSDQCCPGSQCNAGSLCIDHGECVGGNNLCHVVEPGYCHWDRCF